jgi:hypothetical protein
LRCLKTIVDDLRDGEQGVEEGWRGSEMDDKENFVCLAASVVLTQLAL